MRTMIVCMAILASSCGVHLTADELRRLYHACDNNGGIEAAVIGDGVEVYCNDGMRRSNIPKESK